MICPLRTLAIVSLSAATAASAQSTLTGGEAYIDGFAFVGSGATGFTIDERVEWDGVGSLFEALIDESRTLKGDIPGGDFIDTTVSQLIAQNTQILGEIGGPFRGVRSNSSAFGRILKEGPFGGATNNFLESVLTLEFIIGSEGFEYSLGGLLESTDIGGTAELSCSVRMRRIADAGFPLETIINTRTSRPDPDFPFEFGLSGDLAPGNWVLEIVIAGSVSSAGAAPSDTTSSYAWDVTLTVSTPCSGDTNGDQLVDFADLNVLLTNFGMTGFGIQGDLNFDDVVDFLDLNEVLSSFGDVCE
jgi:hypothetical protein